MKRLVFQILVAMLPIAGFAQNASVADEKTAAMQNEITYLLTKTANDFEGMSGAEVTKGETFVMYAATPEPKMNAQQYYITSVKSNKRNYYMAYYTVPQDIAFAKAAIMGMPTLGTRWKMGTVTTDNDVNTSYLYYNDRRVGQLREDLKGKTFSFSIGLFDNTLSPATNATGATSGQTTPGSTGAAAKVNGIQAAIADLVTKASTNFGSIKGAESANSLYSIMYNVTTPPALNAQANYINYCKANGKSYFMAYYMVSTEDRDIMISAFVNMPQYGGSKWKFEQVKKEDKFDDDAFYCNLAYLYYDGIKVAELRKNERGTDPERFFLLSIGYFDKTNDKKPRYDGVSHPAVFFRPSDHLTVANNIISVKNWGPKFDGEYDVIKLATDSCVSGNCKDGHGRKVLAAITNNIPHIRIMEGKFKNNVFLGDGNMLIDGESPVLDGTYELGNWKVSYTHNTLESKAVFHPKDFNEEVTGTFSGYLDDGIGKALDTYQKFVVCNFSPAYDDKKKDLSKWRKEAYSKDYDLGMAQFYLSKEYKVAYEKLKPAEQYAGDSNAQSGTNTKGARLERLNIRRTCGSCGGTGRIYHNQTEYSYSGSTRIATSRRVSETCGACHGSGYLN